MEIIMQTPEDINEFGYLHHFGLKQEPFPVAPDDDSFYISPHIDTVLTEIIHGIKTRKGFMVLTGDTGVGKTTLSRRIIQILDENNIESSLVIHTSCRNVDLLREVNRDFGLETKHLRFGDLMKSLNEFLADRNRNNKNCALIVDDAQNLDPKSLELVRMISNFEADRKKLIQILLIGQPELVDKLNRFELRQLKSRVIIWQTVRPLTRSELDNYLNFKLNVSGNKGRLAITRRAQKEIYRYTGGNLRHVNKLMDRCLYAAFLHDTATISKTIVWAARRDLENAFIAEKKRLRPYALAAGLLLAALLLPLYYHVQVNPLPDTFRRMKGSASMDTRAADATPFMGIDEIVPDTAVVHSLPEPPAKNIFSIPFPVKAFLKSYKLSGYENQFFRSLKSGNLAGVSEIIYKDTGFRLIRLDNMQPALKRKHAVLTYRTESDAKDLFLLFWRPSIKTDDIYFGYRNGMIRLFQEKLADMNFYDFEIDGIAGSRFFKAIVRFQKKMGLKPTGFPDDITLFLLNHECEESA